MTQPHSAPPVPPDFVADLRASRCWPELVDSLWRSPELVMLTYGRLWSLVAEVLPPAPARILDVGCGTGALSLELARAGHEVTAIDADEDAIALAERGAPAGRPGRVTYHHADVHDWSGDEAAFDVVVTTRTLHHLTEPAAALERMRRWLRPGGRLVCVDFLHDRFDRRAARWLAQVRGLLEVTGSYGADGLLPADPDVAADRIEWEWVQEHVVEHQLNDADAIEGPLRRLFRAEAESWHPYLYWDVLVGLDIDDPAMEKATARLVAAWEAALLTADELPSVLLRFVGTH
jgi:ubiquinone/menaquinone biosynthesis C-methylase UbiE